MSQDRPATEPGASPGTGPGTGGQAGTPSGSAPRPGSVVAANWLMIVLIALYGVATVLTVVFDDELVDAWSAGHADSDAVKPPAFVAVAVVMFVVVATLAVVLLRFFDARLGWARVMLTALVVMLIIGTLALARTDPPALFLVTLVLCLVVDLAALVAFWRRDTSVYLTRPAHWTRD